MNVLQCDFVGYFCVSHCLVDVAIVKLEEEIPGNTPVVVQETEGRLITISLRPLWPAVIVSLLWLGNS